jgi:uncharacterized protein (TIGR04222 family)
VNPLDLRGPSFLVFYAVTAAVVLVTAYLLRRWFESGPAPSLREVDPYLVAHLRGGAGAALQVAVLSLLDRGLLRVDGELLVAGADTLQKVRRPIEREVLRKFTTSSRAAQVLQSSRAREACDGLAAELRQQGLLPGAGAIGLRVLIAVAAVALMEAVGFAKMQVAGARGHHNIGILALLMIAVPILAWVVMNGRRTTTGNRYLDDLETMFRGLRERSGNLRVGGGTNELALLLGVFGAPLLGGNVALWTKSLFPDPVRQRQDSWSSSSCGSGGSCGGGGCGGGCGGCGG